MTTQSVLLWECTAEEVEYDSMYNSIRIIYAKKDRVRHDKRFVYLLHKEPPVNFMGVKGAKHGKLDARTQCAEVQ